MKDDLDKWTLELENAERDLEAAHAHQRAIKDQLIEANASVDRAFNRLIEARYALRLEERSAHQ